MRIACRVTKAASTRWQYVTLIAFPLQQWLRERALMLRYTYTACLVYLFSPIQWVPGFFSGVKRLGRKVDHPPPYCAKVNNEWSYTCSRYTGCFTTLGHNCRRWFPRFLWSKSSYKHVSDFGRLRSYGRFLIPIHALVWTASNSWCVMYSLANFSQLQTAVLVISTLGWYLRNAE